MNAEDEVSQGLGGLHQESPPHHGEAHKEAHTGNGTGNRYGNEIK